MSLTFEIDADRRLIIVRVRDIFTYPDIADYQKEVALRPELRGFDEIFDVGEVEKIDYQSHKRVGELAERSAALDTSTTGRLAIVAPSYGAFGLARMYQTYRGLQPNSRKKVAVFRTFEKALQWIENDRHASQIVPTGSGRVARWP